jgi:myo-inositol-1(or 4)-monophosphatase
LSEDYREYQAVAERLAVKAGRLLLDAHGRVAAREKGPGDLVTDADFASQRLIAEGLAKSFPDHTLMAEEEGAVPDPSKPWRWVVDPLDGTINYLYRIPAFAVSIAVEDASGTLAGVVLDPIAGERFEATRSGDPTLNGQPIRPDGRAELLEFAMVATGFNYDAAVRARQAELMPRLLPRIRDIRRVGAAALDLCWCACGRYDAYFERGLNPWDVAAGSLIARRAGLEVRDLAPAEGKPAGTLAAPASFVDELLELIGE